MLKKYYKTKNIITKRKRITQTKERNNNNFFRISVYA